MNPFEQNITHLYGQKGQQWLADLPKLVAQIAAIYGLSDLKPLKNLSYSYVLSGFQNEKPIILKLSLDVDGLKQEAKALKAFFGLGVVEVILEKNGLLLQEQAISGISLTSYFPQKEEEAIHITANIIKRLQKAPMPRAPIFPHIKDWLSVLDQNWNIPASFLQKARKLRDRLLRTATQEVLLHGDLHHHNILQKEAHWIVIDPKGVTGDPTYEVAAFIRNPMPELMLHDDASNLIHYRILRFSELLEYPKLRILEWCFVQAVLTWVWALEDNSDVSYFKHLTELFDRIADTEL